MCAGIYISGINLKEEMGMMHVVNGMWGPELLILKDVPVGLGVLKSMKSRIPLGSLCIMGRYLPISGNDLTK